MPWTNALKNVRKGKFTGVMIASLNSDTKDFIFPKTAIVDNNTYYAVRKDSDFKYTDNNSLKDKVIGIVEEYHFGGTMGQYIEDNYKNLQYVHQMSGNAVTLLNIKALINKHTDLYVDDQYVIKYVAAQNKLSDQIKVVGSINDTHKNYIIFSPALKESQALADMYDEGYKKLLDDGTVQKILVKYDVN
ncbi:Bacterial extracellular solute-binding protein, family 3 [Candidatus Arcanobacter lacustris]|uniref:Bacterial extracellular solute-binding protein, family 3 n=1 Tax=Candidatus Arcanibacter lacustris TaxID=1607817 RepID=A0A0F5MQD2_9RICK|nr:Bacterial extracellular solute-binding protein, family 3 [Candidatus Arcanobacter lacustris]